MKRAKITTICIAALSLMLGLTNPLQAIPMGSVFTYQGRLMDTNDVADGLYDFEFKVFDDPIIGIQQGPTLDVNDIDVIDGYFTVELDFGSIFTGDARWLQIGVRPGDSIKLYTTLSPRQEITPTPYAIYAKNAGTDNDWMVSGSNMYSIPSGNVGIGTIAPDEELVIGTPLGSGWVIPAVTVGGSIGGVFQCGNTTYKLSMENGSTWKRARIVSSDDEGYGKGDIEFRCGNVGIGTTSPSSKLQVEDDTTGEVSIKIHNLDNTGSERLYFGTESGSDAGIFVWGSNNATYPGKWRFGNNKTSAHFDWVTSGGVRMTLSNEGYLGIGTSSPGAKLDVYESGSNDPLRVQAVGITQLIVKNDGKVGIGYASPTAKLFVEESGADDPFRVRVSASTKLIVKNDGNVGIGTLSPTDKLTVVGNVKIDGNLSLYDGATMIMALGSGLDYAEGFDVSAQEKIEPGSVLVIDAENPGKLALSNNAYDTKVAGIAAGAKGLGSGVRLGAGQFDYDVALAGRVYCRVDATESGVEPGDLLTTSATAGYAMKATDYTRAQGAILGKAMEKLEKGQKGQVLVLVTLQ